MIAEQLRAQTKSIHAATEKLLIGYLKPAATLADYAAVLGAFYGFLHPLEVRLTNAIDLSRLPDFAQRRKSSLLLNDLRATGADASTTAIASDSEMPRIATHADAMGALYVFEGSTLGGQAVINIIKSRIELAPGTYSFFEGYGHNTWSRWQTFVAALNSEQHLPHAASIAKAATDTFSSFHSWLQKTLTDAAVEA